MTKAVRLSEGLCRTRTQDYLTRGEEDHQVFQTDKFKAGFLICMS
jgi:predicted amidohydrolase